MHLGDGAAPLSLVKVTGSSNQRVSLAALIAVKPGHRPRLIYRVHKHAGQRKGFGEADTPSCWTTRISSSPVWDWLTVFRLPPYAHELNPASWRASSLAPHSTRMPGLALVVL